VNSISSNPLSRSQATKLDESTSIHTAASIGATIAHTASMCTKRAGIGSTRTSQPSSRIQVASWSAATCWVRSSPVPISITPGSTMATSPPSSAPAVIIPRTGTSFRS
jgi:hypothetical protein